MAKAAKFPNNHSGLKNANFVTQAVEELLNLVGTRYCGDIGFLLNLHRDIDQLRIETEMTPLCDIFFQHHNDVVAIT